MLEHLQSRPLRIGILDFGDGRDFLSQPLAPVQRQFRDALAGKLRADGHEVVLGDEVIWRNDIAVRNGKAMAAADVDAVIFNFSVWAWPQYARVAGQFCPQPIAMFANVNPQYPGPGRHARQRRLARSGRHPLHEDVRRSRRSGGVRRAAVARAGGGGGAAAAGPDVRADRRAFARHRHHRHRSGAVDVASSASTSTTSISSNWSGAPSKELATGTRVEPALAYLKAHVGKIHWTAADATFRLTEDLLKKQLGMYYGAIDLIEEFGYDFCGIKGQRELTEHFATADVAEAFLNDPVSSRRHAQAVDRLLDRSRFGCRADDADLQAPGGHAGAVCRRPALPRRPRAVGPLQQRRARHLLRRAQHRSGGQPREDRVPAAGLLLPGWRRLGVPRGRTWAGDAGPPDASRRPLPHGGLPRRVRRPRRARARGRRDQPGQLAARLREVLVHARRLHPGVQLQPHPRRLRRLPGRTAGRVRRARRRVRGARDDAQSSASTSAPSRRAPSSSTRPTVACSAVVLRAYRHGVIDERLPSTGAALGAEWALQHPGRLARGPRDAASGRRWRGAGVPAAEVVGHRHRLHGLHGPAGEGRRHAADAAGGVCGEPHAWPKLWKHHASQPQATRVTEVAAARGEAWLPRYGGRISSEWMLPKALQVLEEAPATFAAADLIVEGGDWVVWQLTGTFARNACAAGYKGLWHKRDGYPSDGVPARPAPRTRGLLRRQGRRADGGGARHPRRHADARVGDPPRPARRPPRSAPRSSTRMPACSAAARPRPAR